MKKKRFILSALLLLIFAVLYLVFASVPSVSSIYSDAYYEETEDLDLTKPFLDHHQLTGKLDIRKKEAGLGNGFSVITNWGTKPEWINNEEFVFISNQMGDVFLADIHHKNPIRNLTKGFEHAGFTRAFVMTNGDLLLLGNMNVKKCIKDPLKIYDLVQFNGELYLF